MGPVLRPPALKSPLARWRRAASLLPSGLTGYLWLKGIHPGLPGFPCPLRAFTGIPCPACFLTRATTEALHGHIAHSLRLHAFGPPVALALLIWSVLAIRRRRLLPGRPRAWPLGLAAGGLLTYWGVRLTLTYGLGITAFPPG